MAAHAAMHVPVRGRALLGHADRLARADGGRFLSHRREHHAGRHPLRAHCAWLTYQTPAVVAHVAPAAAGALREWGHGAPRRTTASSSRECRRALPPDSNSPLMPAAPVRAPLGPARPFAVRIAAAPAAQRRGATLGPRAAHAAELVASAQEFRAFEALHRRLLYSW